VKEKRIFRSGFWVGVTFTWNGEADDRRAPPLQRAVFRSLRTDETLEDICKLRFYESSVTMHQSIKLHIPAGTFHNTVVRTSKLTSLLDLPKTKCKQSSCTFILVLSTLAYSLTYFRLFIVCIRISRLRAKLCFPCGALAQFLGHDLPLRSIAIKLRHIALGMAPLDTWSTRHKDL
jgi:hypothetical protein